MSNVNDGPRQWVPPAYDEFAWLYLDPGALEGWEAWSLGVKVQPLPGGQLIITGIRIEPFEEHDGRVSDQHLSTSKLRTLPLKVLLAQASMDVSFREANMPEFSLKVREGLRAMEQHQIENDFERNQREIGLKKAQLMRVASLYRNALRWPDFGGPREQIAETLSVSKVTVDRQLRESRKQGFLAAFDGKQAKHGLSVTEGE